jgi:methylase of polypeptide subunit release factors
MRSQPNSFLYNLTTPWQGNVKIYRQLEDFAKSLGWYPSDIIEEKNSNNIATGHLFVEHGLDNSAVISFLNSKHRFDNLNIREQNNLLKVSYNNLVDLHISVDNFKVNGIHNRIENGNLFYSGELTANNVNLTSDFYSNLIEEKHLKANILALDDALIDTISYWKRYISSELNNKVSNEELSNLFNAVIFSRAVEDHFNKGVNTQTQFEKELISNLLKQNNNISLIDVLKNVFKKYQIKTWPDHIIDKESLKIFDKLDYSTLHKFFNDFYFNKYAPYEYDFSIISKHALSRIYERYVSILKIEESPQTTLFAPVPVEHANKASGSYYTPQFIARFFSRFLEESIPDFKFKELKIVEPAVGSGIFLRTILERKSEALENLNSAAVKKSYDNILGVDINATACHASKLSISLLHLVTTGELPKKDLKIFTANALDFFNDKKLNNTQDIFISNPPFVAYNALPENEREKIKKYLGDLAFGRTDLYLPFLKMALDCLKPGGYGLFVLPNTFIISDSAKEIRKFLAANAFIRCLIDLSDIPVFDQTGIYPILLIFEKVDQKTISEKGVYGTKPLATIAKIQDNVGKALHEVLSQRKNENNSFSIYDVTQDFFKNDIWYLLPPSEFSLKNKLDSFKKLGDFLEVRTGFSSGAGEIFLINKAEIPRGESAIYIPYLSDREMNSYDLPKSTEKYFFYPFEDKKELTISRLKSAYPKTYEKLLKQKKKLEKRNEVTQGRLEWWQPNRPRKPDFMLVPKILTPHLVFTPKFSVDVSGKFAVSRTPFMVLKSLNFTTDGKKKKGKNDIIVNENKELLLYFVAVLNSSVCFWYLQKHAPKYQHGYAMLEPKYLSALPIPDPETIDFNKVRQIINLTKERIATQKADNIFIEKKIDKLVTELYGLNAEEIKFLSLDV